MELKDIQAKLDELKTSLETSLSEKQKTEITAQIKTVNDQLAELKSGGVTVEKFVELSNEIGLIKKAVTDNQPVIDKMANFKSGKGEGRIISIKEAIAEKIAEKANEFESFVKGKDSKAKISLDLDIKTVGDMTTAANLTGDPVFTYGQRQGLIPWDKANIRDFIPTAFSATGQYITYVEGAGEGTPTQQTEGSSKAQVDSDLTNQKTVTSYVSAFERFTKQLMYNIPWLQSTLTRILMRKFYKTENDLFYATLSVGSDPLVNTTGGNTAEHIIDMIAEQGGKNFNVDVVFVTFAEWALLMKTALPSGGTSYSVPGGFTYDANGNVRIAGKLVIPARWVTTGDIQSIDTDFIERVEVESLRVEFSYEEGSNFIQNKVTARIECLEELNLLRTDAHSNYGTAS